MAKSQSWVMTDPAKTQEPVHDWTGSFFWIRVAYSVKPNAKYTPVRLRADTHARLCAIRDRMFAAYQQGSLPLPDSQAEHLSLNFVIKHLIENFEGHGRRRARSRRKS